MTDIVNVLGIVWFRFISLLEIEQFLSSIIIICRCQASAYLYCFYVLVITQHWTWEATCTTWHSLQHVSGYKHGNPQECCRNSSNLSPPLPRKLNMNQSPPLLRLTQPVAGWLPMPVVSHSINTYCHACPVTTPYLYNNITTPSSSCVLTSRLPEVIALSNVSIICESFYQTSFWTLVFLLQSSISTLL